MTSWTAHIEGGPMRVNHAAVLIGDLIYSFGGYCSTNDYNDWQPIPVHVLNTATMRWTNLEYKVDGGTVPFERYGHSAVAYGHKVYLWGGRNNAVQCEILACFNTKTLEWSHPSVKGEVPFAKDGHSACLIGNRMYIFAGFEYHSDQYSQEVHFLDLDTMEWTYVEPKGLVPVHRDFHSAVAIGDRMYIFGGRGDLNSPYNSLEEIYCPELVYLDTTANEWVTTNPSGIWPHARRSHSAWYYNGYMYIFGGYNGISATHFNDIWRYSLAWNRWEYWPVPGTPPSKRRRQACIMAGTKMFMFGGTSPTASIDPKTRGIEANSRKAERLIDNSDMHVLDFSASLKTLAICTVLKHNLDQTLLPWCVQLEIRLMSVPNRVTNRREKNRTG